MLKQNELYKEYLQYLAPVLKFNEMVIERGSGSFVFSVEGRKILDLNSGQFCSVFGHAHKGTAECIQNIFANIVHTNTNTLTASVFEAAKAMNDICHGMNGKTIFLSTGAEAVECCLRYAKHLSGNKSGVITFESGYHGLTHGTEGYSIGRRHVKPELPNAFTVPVPLGNSLNTEKDPKQIDWAIEIFEFVAKTNCDKVAVALFEPIVAAGGFLFPPKRYFREIKKICKQYNIFFAFDECQTGFARTGSWYYYQQLECVPDFLITAKALGLGLPVSAVVFNGNTFINTEPTMAHFSSHQNEPYATALVLFAINTIINDGLLERNKLMGAYLKEKLKGIAKEFPQIKNPRGVGLMCAFDFESDSIFSSAAQFLSKLSENNVMLQLTTAKTVRILPNFYVTYEEIDYCCEQIKLTLLI